MTERQKVSLAILASLLLHLIVLGLLMLWAAVWRADPRSQKSPEEPKSLEVTLVPQPTPTPTPSIALATPTPTPSPTPGKVVLPLKMLRSFLDITGLNQSKVAPENAPFESDHNSEAASELPATGSLPMPTQNGKKRPFIGLANMDYVLGKVSPAPEPIAPKEPVPDRLFKAEVSGPQVKEKQEITPEMPEPLATPTPPPQNALALAKPTPVPAKAAPKPSPRTVVQQMPPAPKLQPRVELPAPSYRPQSEQTRVDGGITKRGKAGVAAVGTPLGRYNKAIADAVGSRWYYYIHQRTDLITAGEVRIKFFVTEKGRVQDIRILSNTANDTFAGVAIQSATEAQIPPAPPEVLDSLKDGRIEITYRFVGYEE